MVDNNIIVYGIEIHHKNRTESIRTNLDRHKGFLLVSVLVLDMLVSVLVLDMLVSVLVSVLVLVLVLG
jgi:predicted nucleic acid-binding protein